MKERARGGRARAHSLQPPAGGRARARAGRALLFHLPGRCGPGREEAVPRPPCQSPRRLAAPPAAPARPPAPSCQTVTLSVTVRSNDIRALKQLVIRGVISRN